MKQTLLYLSLSLAATDICQAQTSNNSSLAITIDSLYVIDQQVQTDLVNASTKGAPRQTMDSLYAREFATFRRHIPIIKTLVSTHGYPTVERVGKAASSHFFLLIQHADEDVAFQEQMLALIEPEVKKGNVAGNNFAMLTDRVLLARGKPQLYGSQVSYDDKGNAIAKNLQDADHCNDRRKQYGLVPLEEYLKLMSDMHKEMNPGRYK